MEVRRLQSSVITKGKAMKKFVRFVMSLLVLPAALMVVAPVQAQEAPDALIRRLIGEVQDIVKTDKDIQAGSKVRMMQVVKEKLVPHVDFDRMTALAVGRNWRDATEQQKQALTQEFRSLLMFTYAGALGQVSDQKVEFRQLKLTPTDTDAEVRSRVLQRQGEPIMLNYRVAKVGNEWKIYDVNVMGAWLLETYKSSFATEVTQGGIDGLIASLKNKNQQLAAQK